MKEVELARHLINYLSQYQWEIYQEVETGRPDIVMTLDKLVWVIEVKMSFGLAVIEQACRWTAFAHRVCIAVPRPRRGERAFREKLCRTLGIGLFYVTPQYVEVAVHPVLHRNVVTRLITNKLVAAQKTWGEAGNNTHQYYTPFRNTVANLVEYVTTHPGTTLKAALHEAKHHYRSDPVASSCIKKYIEKGVITQIVMTRVGKDCLLWLRG
jgi:hypothetical protein